MVMAHNRPLQRVIRLLLGLVLLGLTAVAAPAAAKERIRRDPVVSLVAVVPQQNKLDTVLRVTRGKANVAIAEIVKSGFQVGDELFIMNKESVVFIQKMADARPMALSGADTDGRSPVYVIPPSPVPGLPAKVFGWFAEHLKTAMFSDTDAGQGRSRNGRVQYSTEFVLTASRGVETGAQPPQVNCPNPTGRSDEPFRFRAPALEGYDNHLTPGRRRLLLAWNGGVEPFAVRVQDMNRKTLAEVTDIRARCAIFLPELDLKGGPISVILTDGRTGTAGASNIRLDQARPAMPKELAKAGLPAQARTLYYATWLTTQADGAWIWDAVQLVSELGCEAPGAQDWLARYSAEAVCQPR